MEGKTDRTVVRNESFTRSAVCIRERHNERKNGKYANTDIMPERVDYNVWFKRCEGTYEKVLNRMIADGVVSVRGLKPDAKLFGELVFDVNTYFFEMNGGYEYAKQFFEEAYRFAEKEIGSDYVLSAIMHADEIHRGYQQEYGREMYHYHLHVVYLPVVQKEIIWSKRCKDPSLVGKTKEVINQISNSKKWAFVEAKDRAGNMVSGKNGKPVLIPSYSILQDKFYNHMVAAGFDGFERGERGSTTEHMTVIEYKTEKASQRLAGMEDKITEEEKRLEAVLTDRQDIEQIEAYADDVSRMGRFNRAGNIEVTEKQHMMLTTLAREGLYSRRTLIELRGEVELWKNRFNKVLDRFKSLYEETRDMRVAFRIIPDKIKDTIADIFSSNRVLVEREIFNDTLGFNQEIKDQQPKDQKSHEKLERLR